ncbi:Gas vesicle synthesis protein GvpL/GvpF [Enhydrobacter aerosaccus]|uniref:Gas vesicle synthesis protein GvpL/GvpF n=1 Tax=Enhydrobacter aerosaccus TaxID=225324 RepID=A0A1T4LUY2_9HYPH|nr:GvpL/GvpF family gas vesicle protein [Enhydrobacter aerosaccus]SJZ58549.1 Gas vesicle synthesis protein GvpL/GvpF [Enhydrobacter aerosaccus]
MLYVYGIADNAFEVLRGAGLLNSDVFAVPAGCLAAAASKLAQGGIETTPQGVWRHEQVLRQLMQDHAVLPLRFGTICRDRETLTDRLMEASDDLVRGLGRVRGKVEIALRIVDEREHEAHPVPSETPTVDAIGGGRGTAYLRARRRHHAAEMGREARAERVGKMLSAYIDVGAEDLVCSVAPEGDHAVSVSCLLGRDQLATLQAALERFQSDHPAIGLSWTGPWTPYSFVAPSLFGVGLP